jgi:hypothetical protein
MVEFDGDAQRACPVALLMPVRSTLETRFGDHALSDCPMARGRRSGRQGAAQNRAAVTRRLATTHDVTNPDRLGRLPTPSSVHQCDQRLPGHVRPCPDRLLYDASNTGVVTPKKRLEFRPTALTVLGVSHTPYVLLKIVFLATTKL